MKCFTLPKLVARGVTIVVRGLVIALQLKYSVD